METFLQPSSHVALLASVDDETGIETSSILESSVKDRRKHLIVMIVDGNSNWITRVSYISIFIQPPRVLKDLQNEFGNLVQ